MAGQSSLLHPVICQKPVIGCAKFGQLRAMSYGLSDRKHAIVESEAACSMLEVTMHFAYHYLAPYLHDRYLKQQ